MISRIPKERTELTYEGLKANEGNKIILEYYLLESVIEDMDELKGKMTYGIEVVKTMEDGEAENARVGNVSSSITEAERIIGLLSCNGVTPVSLKYVLEDMVGV